jgi:hypothetical protein
MVRRRYAVGGIGPVCWPIRVGMMEARKTVPPRKGRGMQQIPVRDLSTGSDYRADTSDPYTPNSDQAPPLAGNVSNPEFWGETPADYVNWFNGLWHSGDPSGWGPQVFTPNAIMLDPAGTSTGAAAAASDFLLLFQYFPDLRGEVVSWSCNDTEIFINWRFVVQKNLVCPVIDKFSFTKGLVSYRQAYFDTVMLLSYLAENYGSGPVVDYFVDRFVRATGGGGVLFLPGLIWAFVKGAFRWASIPPPPPRHLAAVPASNKVMLTWSPVPNARWYRVSRATTQAGPYPWIAQTGEPRYEDDKVTSGTEYFYRVSSLNSEPPLEPLPSSSSTTTATRTI